MTIGQLHELYTHGILSSTYTMDVSIWSREEVCASRIGEFAQG